MSDRPTALERAFQLARSGRPSTVDDIKKTLNSEGYFSDQIQGKALSNQLRALIQAARLSSLEAPKPEARAK
jgi:hypothetical protein